MTKYGSDKELPPTFSPWEVYQYSDQMLKDLPTDALKTMQKTLLFSKKKKCILQVKIMREEITTQKT